MFWLLMLGAICGGIAGVLLDTYAEQALRGPLLIAGTLSVWDWCCSAPMRGAGAIVICAT